MEYCNDRHDLVYHIRYKPSRPGGAITEWKICEKCFEKDIFGDDAMIESITVINSNRISRVDIEKISILTQKFTAKIKMLFFKH